MDPTPRGSEGNASAPVLYMAHQTEQPVRLARLGEHAASGVRHRMPTRIEGSDERVALAPSSRPGKPTRRALAGLKTRRIAM
jgi:hypothetical protein